MLPFYQPVYTVHRELNLGLVDLTVGVNVVVVGRGRALQDGESKTKVGR